MDVREFQEKLKEIQETARSQGGNLKAEQIRETFGNAGLDSSQQAGVLRYLTSQGISIEGADAGKHKEQQEERQAVPLTEEEKAYFREYMDGLPREEGEEDREALFAGLAGGSKEASQRLAALYMKEAARLAAEMNTEEIFIADMIQEANLALMQALENAGSAPRDEAWLLTEIRKGLEEVCREQKQQKFRDDSLVARVEKLESAVRELSDDEDDARNAFSINELAIILDMDVEEIRDTLRLTGDDK